MSRRANPKAEGWACVFCGRPAQSFCHKAHKGIGGDPKGKRTAGFFTCGVDHSGDGCHALHARRHIQTEMREDGLYYLPDAAAAEALRSRGMVAVVSEWQPARYYGCRSDEVGDER